MMLLVTHRPFICSNSKRGRANSRQDACASSVCNKMFACMQPAPTPSPALTITCLRAVACDAQLLPVFNLFRGMNSNMGDSIDYNQRSRINVGELIMETLEVRIDLVGRDITPPPPQVDDSRAIKKAKQSQRPDAGWCENEGGCGLSENQRLWKNQRLYVSAVRQARGLPCFGYPLRSHPRRS